MDTNIRWQWLDTHPSLSKPEWKPYEESIQKSLSQCLKSKQETVQFNINGIKFKADLNRMTQENLTTGYQRQLRIQISDKNGAWASWLWLNRISNEWMYYTAHNALQLECAFNDNNNKALELPSTTQIEIKSGEKFLVDFEQMSSRSVARRSSTRVKREVTDVTNVKEEPLVVKEEQTLAKVRKEEVKKENKVKKEKVAGENEENERCAQRSLRKRKSAPVYIYKEDKDSEEEEEASKVKKTKKGASTKKSEDDDDDDYKAGDVEEDVDVADDDYVEEEEANEDVKPKYSSGRRSKTNTKAKKTQWLKSMKPMKPVVESADTIKTLKFSGDIPVDEKFIEIFGAGWSVYKEDDRIYDVMLNQTNLQYNNNKFYMIQIVKKDAEYTVWMRWGRVGKDGQTTSFQCGADLNEAKEIFENKFYDKTRNEFGEDFEKCPGKYDLVEKDYSSKDLPVKSELEACSDNKVEVTASKLDKKVQELIGMICNISEMESLLKEMKYDAKKAPLGKLSQKQINQGYEALKQIEEHLNAKEFGKKFVQANNDFYTRIPHDFGMRVPPLISTLQLMREKMKLLEVLGEIEVAVNAMNQESDIVNPIDRQYDQLDCKMEPLAQDHKMIRIIDEYLQKNHAPTHCNYTLKLRNVYEVEKPRERENFISSNNRMLLWHGSRMTNWYGILSQGLRIAPPEAPVTGYMFGKGCYFSDSSSKSANYCYTTMNKNVGLLSLSEVSLGEWNELKQADYEADKLPEGKLSTKGVGKSEPDKSTWVTLDDGCVVPIGRLKNQLKDPKTASEYALLYNEYIVYNTNQVRLRYLVEVEFDYDD